MLYTPPCRPPRSPWIPFAIALAILLFTLWLTSCQKWNSTIVGYRRELGHDNRAPRSAYFCDTLHWPRWYDTVYKAYNNMPVDLPQGLETDNADGTRDYCFYDKVVSVNGVWQ